MSIFLPLFGIIGGIILILILIWLAILIMMRPVPALAVGLVLAISSLSSFSTPVLRISIAAVLIPHFLNAVAISKQGRNTKLPSFTIALVYVATCFLSMLWSSDALETIISASAWIILLLFIFTFRSTIDPQTIQKVIFYVLLSFFCLSVIFLLTPLGWEAGRATGVFDNANASGIFTFLLIGLSVGMGRKFWIWVVPAGTFLILATGSRAALLAVIVFGIVVLLGRTDWRLRWPFIGISISVGIPLATWVWKQIQSMQTDDTSVLRTNNSRENVWGLAFEYIRLNPVLGAGYGATPRGIGSSSYLKLLAEFGFAFAWTGIALAIAYLWWSRKNIVTLGITAGTLINTIFEDWLLTAGAPMLIVYLLFVMSTIQDPEPRSSESKNSPPRLPSSKASGRKLKTTL